MELKKEDFKRFRIVDTFFWALPGDFFEKKTVNTILESTMEIDRLTEELEILEPDPIPEPEVDEKEVLKDILSDSLEAEREAKEQVARRDQEIATLKKQLEALEALKHE